MFCSAQTARNVMAGGALFALAASTVFAVPAAAGQISLRIQPKGEAATVARTGLQLYSLFRSQKNRAKVDQRGSDNGAAIAQHGSGNAALVSQRGSGHSGQITQSGNGNAFGLFQFGRGTQRSVTQNGDGRVGFEFVGGW